jgi:hypothetical protein
MGGGRAVMVMAAEANLVPSAFEVAFKVTMAGLGTTAGAVKVTEVGVALDSVPQADPEQPPLDILQLTPRFDGSFATDTVNDVDLETWTDTADALRETVTCCPLPEA